MLSRPQYREAIERIAHLELGAIVAMIKSTPAKFPIDFTDAWLASRSIAELRHVLAAICLHCEVMPPEPTARSERAA